MNYETVIEITAAITTHARFSHEPGDESAATACGVGYYAITKKGKKAGVQIYEITPPNRDGAVSVSFAAHDGRDGSDYDATHDDAHAFTVVFSPHATDRDAVSVAVDTGTGPDSFRFDVTGSVPARAAANAIIRYVCDAHDIGRKK